MERTYASGHVFLSPDRLGVYLITTEKQGIRQHQFTGGSPLEDELKSVFSIRDDIVMADLSLAEQNACRRTTNRTSTTSIISISHVPLVDWVLLERQESWRLVCLMHFVVKSYEGTLSPQVGVEDTVGGGWHLISQLESSQDIAPNVSIITEKALEMTS